MKITLLQTPRTSAAFVRIRNALRHPARAPWASAAMALLMTGCASVGEESPERTADAATAAVATQWPADVHPALHANAQGAVAAELSWRSYIAYAPLQALIATALDNNRDLRVALLRVQEARAAYAIQRADQFPTVGLSGQAARSRVPGDLNATGRSAIGSEYRAGVGITSWEIDLWGRVQSLNEAALQQFLATEQAQRGMRAALIAEVANAYIGLRELDERLAIARQTIATRQESFRIFSRREQVGSASRLELTQVETLLIQARTLAAQLEQMRAAQAHAITLLAGTPIDLPQVANTEAALLDQDMFMPLRAGLPADLLVLRPDIHAAERQLHAARANVRAARAAFLPRIALTGSLGSASAELDGLFKGSSRAWTFAPSISLPLFDAGRLRAHLDVAKVRTDLAVAHYEKTIQTAFREVSDALSNQHWLAEQLALQRSALDVQMRRTRLAQLRYDAGATTYLDVLDSQRDLLNAQQQLVQVRRALLSNQIVLYAALGGGSDDLPATTTATAANPNHTTH